MTDKVKCAECNASIGRRMIATTSKKVVCWVCHGNFSIHLTCLRKLLLINNDGDLYVDVAADTSKLSYFECSSCRKDCPLCGASHSLLDSDVELLLCSNSCLHRCYIIGLSKNNLTGCLSKLSPPKRKLFVEQPYLCADCIKEDKQPDENHQQIEVENDKNYTYDTTKIFGGKITCSE